MTSEKTDPKKAPDTSRPLRRRSSVLRLALRALLVVLLVLLLLALWVSTLGLPSPVTRRVEERLRENDLHVGIGRIRWEPAVGIVAEDVTLSDREGAPCPVFEAQAVTLGIGFGPSLRTLRVHQGTCRVSAEGELTRRDSPRNITVEHMDAHLVLRPEGVRVESLVASLAGVRIEGEGRVLKSVVPRERVSFGEWMQRLSETLAREDMAWVALLVEEVNSIEHGKVPVAEVHFTIDSDESLRNEATVVARGRASRVRGVVFDEWRLDAGLADGRVDLVEVLVRCGGNAATVSGSLDMETQVTAIQVQSALSPVLLTELIPVAWHDEMERQGVFMGGVFEIELALGPAPAAEVLEHIEGHISLEQSDFRGVWIEKGSASIAREGSVLRAENVDAVLGRGKQQGRVAGSFSFDLAEKRYGGHVMTTCDPNALISMLDVNQSRIVSALTFNETPPQADVEFVGIIGEPKKLILKGEFKGTNFMFRGSHVAYLETTLSASNGVIYMDPFLMTREDGQITGWIRQDIDGRMSDFDLLSSVDPKAIARMIGPGPERNLRHFRFNGPTRVKAYGRVDYGRRKETDFTAEVEAEQMQVKWGSVDRVSFVLRGRSAWIGATNIDATVYRGHLHGDVEIYTVGGFTNVRYEVDMTARGVDFQEIVENATQKETEQFAGLLDGRLVLAGYVGEGRGDTAFGYGGLRVREGRLFQIPVLGGLSRFLSRVQPGWGFAQQTDFTANFDVRDRKIHTDAVLEGEVVTIHFDGRYYFDTRLDFDVEVQPLKAGGLRDAIRVITLPFSKLFELHLGGKLDDPRWRPVNFPKELFLIFD